MIDFKIGSEFLIDGQPIKLLSGAVHYFRIAPSQWRYTLEKMIEAGLNTVETYIPWNVHEPVEGKFNFSGQADLVKFIELAADLGLYVIVRPSPYICAEWEFGGFPAWLLRYPDMIVRTNTPRFIEKVAHYYQRLFKELVPLQFTHGGPILMMQVENEYGSFGNDKNYLRKIKSLMEENGVDVPLFTADGGWQQALQAGSLIEDDVLATANFGSHVAQNLQVLQSFFDQHHQKWPLMCMEFWDGWFNRWGDDVIKRDETDFEISLKELIDHQASFNLYMFRGGTNFAYYNGCSSRHEIDLPQITSYDYDAILHEDGTENDKFKVLQTALAANSQPRLPQLINQDLPTVQRTDQVRVFDVLAELTQPVVSDLPQSMENLGSGYGYVLYQTMLTGYDAEETLQLVDARDRVDVYLNQHLIATQYQATLGETITVELQTTNHVDLLIENMGRVNYGARLLSPIQRKGLGTGLIVDRHFHYQWRQWALDFCHLEKIDWTKHVCSYGPTLNRFKFELGELANTYLDCQDFGKGIVLVNGQNIGKYWSVGPKKRLYIPADFLKKGDNEIVVMETTACDVTTLNFMSNGD
ncbi:glycoside hydrolase family 35 protein [Lapidilactobacillus bayanensis]|uniref:glycoside hydrolase family 35 protein n=1 Tax=Lapidilactobacillus bayanensis TaxID=2485998 RepID=UPI000F7952A9|nr:beta-galactosidase family protein [Lapidilactobacillus bayanensis]